MLDSTEKDIDIHEVRARVSPKRPDRCILDFESTLPRKYRQSIYSQNEGIQESCMVDKDRALQGRDLQTFWQEPRPMHFKYDKAINEGDLDNSQDLYLKIIKSKESVDYLKKCMEKRGLIKEAKNPLKGTRFA